MNLLSQTRTVLALREAGITNIALAEALRAHPRGEFAPRDGPDDLALPIGEGQSVLPVLDTVALIHALGDVADRSVALIGGGSGWSAALLLALGARLQVVERRERLADAIRLRFEGQSACKTIFGDGYAALLTGELDCEAAVFFVSLDESEYHRITLAFKGAIAAPVREEGGLVQLRSSRFSGPAGLTLQATPRRVGTVIR